MMEQKILRLRPVFRKLSSGVAQSKGGSLSQPNSWVSSHHASIYSFLVTAAIGIGPRFRIVYIYMYVCIHVCMYIYICIYIYMCMYDYMIYICTLYMYIHTHIYIYTYIYIFIYVYIYIFRYVYMNVDVLQV